MTSNPQFVEQGIRVFDMDDGYSFYAAADFESAMTCALADWAPLHSDNGEYREAASDAALDLDAHTINVADEGEPPETITFREQIKRLLASGATFPQFFCGIDA